MNFTNFYFDNPIEEVIKDSKPISIPIKEEEYGRFVDFLSNDFRMVVESEEYKDEYGYGYKYLMRDGQSAICLNKYKDEIDNSDALFIGPEEICQMIREKINK